MGMKNPGNSWKVYFSSSSFPCEIQLARLIPATVIRCPRKQKIFTLHHGAIQEIDRQLHIDKEEIKSLNNTVLLLKQNITATDERHQQRTNTIQQQHEDMNAGHAATVDKLRARIDALESQIKTLFTLYNA